ncbi:MULTISPECIES: glycosyltransferase [unclassified Sphingomonas]|uniref:glycosyltransferase family 4 protein n=1 Tax=unclassified Sphingomonas TaxID=196159 RepID=UPI002269EA99|nr:MULTISPECIES: glycosyltransferase [unclassified Sphingomonas]
MKLLLTTDAVGGVWQYTTELAHALAAQGVESVVAVLGPSPTADQRATLVGHAAAPAAVRLRPPEQTGRGPLAPITLIDTGLPLDWMCDSAAPVRAAGLAIAALAADHAVDLVQFNMPTLAAAATLPIPSIAVTHGCVATWWAHARSTPLAADYRWHRALTADGLVAVDRVVAPSAAYAAIVADHYQLARPVLAIHNGRSPLRSFDAAAPMADVALTVGRLWDGVKNAALLDGAAARLPIPFLAAGATRGPHGETIALSHLRELGQLGADAIAAHLARRPIFVSAASFEPFGLAVLEAAQAGCALVLADNPVFRELWDGAATFVALDGERWCTAIEALVLDTDRRRALGEAARVRAVRYTPEATATQMLALYREVIAARPPQRQAAA